MAILLNIRSILFNGGFSDKVSVFPTVFKTTAPESLSYRKYSFEQVPKIQGFDELVHLNIMKGSLNIELEGSASRSGDEVFEQIAGWERRL